MRPQIVVAALAVVALPILGWMLSRPDPINPEMVAPPTQVQASSVPARSVDEPPPPVEPTVAGAKLVSPAPVPPVRQRVVGDSTVSPARPSASSAPADSAELLAVQVTQYGEEGDLGRLPEVLTALDHPDRRVRSASLEATVQLASRDALPKLQEVADRLTDSREKAEVLNAIDYLSLPTFTEWRAAKRAK